ncbi:MAG: methylmalonyl Co-A mutase-associated GTPase MeaB [Flavobacteriales bacterium]|nr:methylmalonyl Co-A mutase-associated GTPase MeaB [Flavobacteriales bacterium]MCX7650289.1 methylmalonyl Co-A mutase-associated GTPase MeaB [Flavobacteriales bacterium]MDW8431923.1 methylmalonyl Co-A mutase-associated GTPase MeaB [Flavobacteriales bacterium]
MRKPGTAQAVELAESIRQGDRRALAQAITLVESQNPEKKALASDILKILAPEGEQSFRIGISGIPGAGKSTLIESLGLELIERGHRVAVLSIDPSSLLSGGSILGDKTRMARLAAHPEAYIRPSPSRTLYGGLAPHTFETIFLCEAAGFDRILIETVGTGQSETDVAYVADFLLLINVPGQGDDLQGVKRGIMELCDMVLVNKAEDPEDPAVQRALSFIRQALNFLPSRPHGMPVQVKAVSALKGLGISELAEDLETIFVHQRKDGYWKRSRLEKLQFVFTQHLRNAFWYQIQAQPKLKEVFARAMAELKSHPYCLYRLSESVLKAWLGN